MARDASGGSFFCTNRCGMPPAAHSFLSCQKRMGRKEAPENEIALTRLKKHFVSACHSLMIRPARNALRAAVESGFPSARYAVRVALFAPVEYLTYESRSVPNIKGLVGADAPVHPTSPQSISTTTPVYQRRICGAFCKLKKATARTKLRGKSKEGGRSPLLGRFKGDCQGGESKLPLDYSFFRPSTALSFSYEKESGVETVPFLPRQKRVDCRRHSY